LGYNLRLYQLLTPNIRAWLQNRAEIFPAVLQVQTINRCNAACCMCPYPYTVHREPYQMMSDDLWEKIALECAVEPSLQVLIPMEKNEPLLDPKLEARMAFFRNHAQPYQQLELVTNGALLTAERLARLVKSGMDLITISVNAGVGETYRTLTGGLDWERLTCNLRSIEAADTSQVIIFLRFVQQAGNQNERRTFYKEWGHIFNLYTFEVNNRAGTVLNYEQMQLKPKSLGERVSLFLKRWLPLCLLAGPRASQW
jgi:sulfatase maturation enzyme AslB (radical SAM superfamily)